MPHEKFNYRSLDELAGDIAGKGIDIPLSKDLSILGHAAEIGKYRIQNRLAIHPMEGNDGELDGSPSELTRRRYGRFAESGAGLIWFEAVAVSRDGRASPRQLWINRETLPMFRMLLESIRKTAADIFGQDFRPVIICQLTHSGRFSKPDGKPAPIIAYHNPVLNTRLDLPPEYPVVTDERLDRLEEEIEEGARLALEAGFDGVDLKACHRYICSELLSAYNREGKYGGSFESRSRFLLDIIKRVNARFGNDLLVASRLNAFDGICPPLGFGTDAKDITKYDFTETKKLIDKMGINGVKMINITMGTPYYNPHVNRPFDLGLYVPEEHPLAGVSRMLSGCGELAKAFPDIKFVGTGFTWLRQYGANAAAGCIEKEYMSFAGFGRQGFAYPDFARDILAGGMDGAKCCIACGKCSDIMRLGGPAGCVVRDGALYGDYYKQYCKI